MSLHMLTPTQNWTTKPTLNFVLKIRKKGELGEKLYSCDTHVRASSESVVLFFTCAMIFMYLHLFQHVEGKIRCTELLKRHCMLAWEVYVIGGLFELRMQ